MRVLQCIMGPWRHHVCYFESKATELTFLKKKTMFQGRICYFDLMPDGFLHKSDGLYKAEAIYVCGQ